jgi:hypothetical protein
MELGEQIAPIPTPHRPTLAWFDHYFATEHQSNREASGKN